MGHGNQLWLDVWVSKDRDTNETQKLITDRTPQVSGPLCAVMGQAPLKQCAPKRERRKNGREVRYVYKF